MTGQPDIAAALAWSGEAARAAANAQAALRGEPVPALLISSEAHLAGAEASPANPYGSSKHGRFDAGSEPQNCLQRGPGDRFSCSLAAGHRGYHEAHGTEPLHTWQDGDTEFIYSDDRPEFCPAQWGEPPETMLCSLPSGHDGNHATAEGVEWGGRWETAEPKAEPSLSKPWLVDLHVCGVRFEFSAPVNCPDVSVHHATAEPGDVTP